MALRKMSAWIGNAAHGGAALWSDDRLPTHSMVRRGAFLAAGLIFLVLLSLAWECGPLETCATWAQSGVEGGAADPATQSAADLAKDGAQSTDGADLVGGGAETRSGAKALVKFAAVAAVFVIPLLLGGWLAKQFRMADYGGKFGLAIFSLAAAALVLASGELKLGPDLSGGITLIYELEDASAGTSARTSDGSEKAEGGEFAGGEDAENANQNLRGGMNREQLLDVLIKALAERVDPSGIKEVTIRKYGEGQIEIIIPQAGPQELESIQRQIYTAGALEFRITASPQFKRHRTIIDLAERLDPGNNIVMLNGKEVARWVPYKVEEFGPPDQHDGPIVKRKNVDTPQALILTDDGIDVTGEYLSSVSPGIDETGHPQVNFTFNASGANKFRQLTGNNLPNPSGQMYNLGILLDGELKNAPSIRSRISSQGQISGGMTDEEVEFLVSILNAGSLPAALNKDPISREQISPTLGQETVQKGQFAVGLSMAAVVLFMLLYYRTAGIVACIALAANLLLILGAMVLFKGAFTLPGLAGLALTVGMSVDANVLIFERIREELNRGAALRMAIRNGFQRATQTIIDANVTTLITAVVIYKIAPDNVKGFGLTLILGILMSMYTAIFLSRLIFDVAERMRWIKRLDMARIIGDTAYDFIGNQGKAIGLSLAAIAIGIAGVAMRGRDLLNIDFTGGSSVTMVLDQAHKKSFSEVKSVLETKTDLGDKNLTLVELGGGKTRYTVTTVNQDVDDVQAKLTEAFKNELQTYHVEVENLTELPSANFVPRRNLEAKERLEARLEKGAADARYQVSLLQDDKTSDSASADDQSATPAVPSEEVPLRLSDPDSEVTEGDEFSPSDEPADSESASADSPIGGGIVDRFAGGTSALLKFGMGGAGGADANVDASGVSFETLDQRVRDALQATGNQGVAYRITNPEYKTGSAHRFPKWTLKLALDKSRAQAVFDKFRDTINSEPVFPLANKIGGRVAGRMAGDAIAAIVISLLGIVAYIWFRFQRVMYGLAAVAALIHDVLITLGVVALSAYLVSGASPLASLMMVEKFQISLPLVAAFLTIIGYSLNDTIVVFDRIREVKGKSPKLNADMINASINQTLSRTLLTSLTTLLTAAILYVWGGDGIHAFAFALVIGVITGTYSSIFIASPLLLWMSQRADAAAASAKP